MEGKKINELSEEEKKISLHHHQKPRESGECWDLAHSCSPHEIANPLALPFAIIA
jgi:hypothetical protein